ncbi:MAG: porin [Verrucomicrobia bacterium]|nr:porin [Verrucomicrobiota bacterium]
MRKQLLLLALLGSGTIQSHAEATGLFAGKTYVGDTTYDQLWSLPVLFKDEANPILQEFSLQGRLQVQYADGDSNGHYDIEDYQNGSAANAQSVWDDKFEARRARLGFKSKWFQNWKFEGQIDADTTDGLDDFYRDIYDLYLTYAPSDALNVTVGKTKVKFGREQEISSKEILTFERSLVSNLLFPGELTGLMVNGKGLADHWLYELGIYGSERSREFANFDQGAVILGKVGYDYAAQAGLDTAVASLQYMHNSEPGYREKDHGVYYASASPSFTDSIALTNDITQGRFGLTTDVLYGFGYSGTARQAGKTAAINQSDVFGISIIPSYFVAKGLQLVGQLQVATSADPNGLGLYGRYEKWAPVLKPTAKGKDAGNTYTSAYLGLNYYLYGHKLKLMNGIEFSHLGGGNYDGYTFLSGLRFSF